MKKVISYATSWSRGNYFRVGRENKINIEWNIKWFRAPTLSMKCGKLLSTNLNRE